MVPDTDVLFNMIPMQAKPVYSLKEKIKRTTQLLKELKVLSQDCQELEKNQEKDQQLFSRRTLQVGAEIQDARDLLSSICQNRLPLRQWQFLFDSKKEDGDEDHVNSCLTGFDMDPSVQFLGIDWERVSGRCFSLSMHANILESILLDDSKVEIDNLVLINKMLRDLAAIEADVLSHSEAVLRGRLSKSQRQLILDQQVKYASISSSSNHQVSKSRSFRDTSGKSRPSQRAYRKNKTTHLDKLTTSMSAHTIRCSNSSDNEDDNLPVQVLDKKTTVVSIRRKSSSASSPQGFMQNVSSMFKNIR